MPTPSELTDLIASAVVAADPTDLPALAHIHDQLQALARAADALPAVQAAATGAEKLVERIVLDEVADASAALKELANSIESIQSLIDGKVPVPASSSTPAVMPTAQTPAAPPPAVHEVAPQAKINPDDIPLVEEFVAEAAGHIEAAEGALLKIEEDPHDQETLNAIFRAFHTIKGVAGFLNLSAIQAAAHAAENLLDKARKSEVDLVGAAADLSLEALDTLKAMIEALRTAIREDRAPAPPATLPSLLARLQAAADGAAATPAPVAASAQPSPDAAAPAAQPAAAPQAASGKPSGDNADSNVKVSTERLDALINMVGELVIAQAMVSQDTLTGASTVGQRLSRNMTHLSKITRELQDLSMSMRMVPIAGVFQKMARLARDTARKASKRLDFVVVGGETELDRNVVEAISDPLVHMVRNSIDHGIEPPDQRAKSGKPEAGHVELRASHRAGNIVIEIIDDGRGLNKAKIIAKAIAAGIIREGQELTDPEIFKLIFHAGLSTAEKVTDISGRGVGMDVVRRNVEALRGRIDIESTEGKGSVFTIRLPLTLAVIDGQVVKVGAQRYIIPTTSIEQSIRPKAEQLSTVQSRGEMCMVRGGLLPLVRLHRLFSVEPKYQDPTTALVVIVADDTRRCCLLVDELLGQQQVVIKSLGEALGPVPGISGGAILGDGAVSLILDVPGLIRIAGQ